MTYDETKLTLVAEHYSESFSVAKHKQVLRDRYFLFLLLILLVFIAQYEDKTIVARLLKFALKDSKELANAAIHFADVLLWFLLAGCTIRYYQTEVFLQKSYKYLHEIEKVLQSCFLSPVCFSREGKSYLGINPATSEFVRALFQGVVPMALFNLVLHRAVYKDIDWDKFAFEDVVIFSLCLIIVIATCCYFWDLSPSLPRQKLDGVISDKIDWKGVVKAPFLCLAMFFYYCVIPYVIVTIVLSKFYSMVLHSLANFP